MSAPMPPLGGRYFWAGFLPVWLVFTLGQWTTSEPWWVEVPAYVAAFVTGMWVVRRVREGLWVRDLIRQAAEDGHVDYTWRAPDRSWPELDEHEAEFEDGESS